MARKGENIYYRGNGRWEGKYIKGRLNGKILYGYVSGKNYQEVLEKKQKALQFHRGRTDQLQSQGDNLKFSSVASEWMENQAVLLKYSSISKYRNILNKHLLPQFGDKYIMEITRDEVSSYMVKLLTSGSMQGRGLSPKYVTGILSVLKTVLGYGANCKKVQTASLQGISVKIPRKTLRVLSVNEQHRLESCLLGELDLSGLGIILCLYTGIRLGELCALKWKSISFTDRTLHISATMSRVQIQGDTERKTRVIITMPKSECSVRYIPIPDKIFQMLRVMQKPQDTYFLTGLANVYVEPRTMENRFKARIKACGIADANFHSLRHTFATRCIELGFDARTLSEILGHASVKITMDRYVHPSMTMKQKNMDKLSSIFSSPWGGRGTFTDDLG